MPAFFAASSSGHSLSNRQALVVLCDLIAMQTSFVLGSRNILVGLRICNFLSSRSHLQNTFEQTQSPVWASPIRAWG
jgi:hypothetical protein